jgi:multidrug efflux system membrane fusion protein
MRCRTVLIGVVLAGAGLVSVSCKEPPARQPPPPPKVTVAPPVVRDEIEYDQYNGYLAAVETVDVRSRVRGHIDKVNFTDGQIVEKDMVLFVLDPRPFQANLRRAMDEQKVFEAQKVAADKEEARLRELFSRGGSSQSQLDKVIADALSLAAQVEAAAQEVERQKLDLEYSEIRAPIRGRIGKAQLTAGNLVNAGGTDPVLATIVTVDPMYVYFNIDERSLQRYMRIVAETNQGSAGSGELKGTKRPFSFALETDTGFPHSGELDFINNQVDRRTGTVLLRGEVKNPKGMFVDGARARVRLPVSPPTATTLVPDSAILADQSRRYVLVVDEKGMVQRKDLSLGRLLDDGMRVVNATERGPGLLPTDRIIVVGIQAARINYPVEVVTPQGGSRAANP